MHIVFLNTAGQIGGAERSALNFLASLREAQPDWRLSLVAGEKGPLLKDCEEIGVDAYVAPLPPELARLGDSGAGGPAGEGLSKTVLMGRLALASFSGVRYMRSLRKLLKELAPDLIHANGLKMHVFGAWTKPAKTPLIWHLHDYVSSRPVMARFLRRSLKGCTSVIANSASVEQDFKSVFKPRIRVHRIWNAVDLKEFSPGGPKLDLDSASCLPKPASGVLRIGLVGTFAKQKGHQVFLRAIAKLPHDLPSRAYVIGGAVYQTDASQWRLDQLQKEAAQLGLTGRIGFTGFINHCADAMRALDIIVHASTQPEPFGMVIAEAMACRRALIASPSGGAGELFADGINALSHTPGDPEQLGSLIVTLAANPAQREGLAEEGRRTAEKCFDRRKLAPQLLPIYRSLISSPAEQIA